MTIDKATFLFFAFFHVFQDINEKIKALFSTWKRNAFLFKTHDYMFVLLLAST